MLDKNQIFSFERGAYFSGDLRYAIVVNEGRYVFKGEAFNDFNYKDIFVGSGGYYYGRRSFLPLIV